MCSSELEYFLEGNFSLNISFRKHPFTYFLLFIILILLLTIIIFGIKSIKSNSSLEQEYSNENQIIGYPLNLPKDGTYIQWNILQLNDVYEMLPLNEGNKGGLARVAHLRKLLLQENSQTITILSGDFLSPSALSHSKVNGTMLNGKQMIQGLNTLGLDYVTFGNHEFDLNQSDLISRINESKFAWISSNVFSKGTNQTFSSTIPYHILRINQLQILLIGLTIDVNNSYVDIISQKSLISFVKSFLQSLSHIKYDLLIALTHLDLQTDILLAENIREIDLILGGHEHENYLLRRGSKSVVISKADSNAFSVYIHRCAFHLHTKQFHVYSTLTEINSLIENEEKTNEVVNYWFNLGIKGFEQIGFKPHEMVCCLPNGIELDGRSSSVRNFQTLLTKHGCECMINVTESNRTTVALFDSGQIRVDDILRGKISQYDILRTLPYENNLFVLSVPGKILHDVLSNGMSVKGSGMYLAYSGVKTSDGGKTWFIDGKDISKGGKKYNVVTIQYAKEHTQLKDPEVTVLKKYNMTQTKSLINYLKKVYPCVI